MLADCELALDQLGPEGWWRPTAQVAAGLAHGFLGDGEHAGAALELAIELSAAAGAFEESSYAFAALALLAMDAGAWEDAAVNAERAVAIADEARLEDYLSSGLARAAAARVAIQQGDVVRARENVAKIHRIRPLFNTGLPWMSVQIGLELTRLHLALGEARAAATVLREAEAILRVRPRLGTLVDLAERAPAARRRPVESERRMGPQPHRRRAPPAAPADHASRVSPDRRAAVPVAHDHQDARGVDLPEVRRLVAGRGDRARRGARPAGGLALRGAGEGRPVGVIAHVRVTPSGAVRAPAPCGRGARRRRRSAPARDRPLPPGRACRPGRAHARRARRTST